MGHLLSSLPQSPSSPLYTQLVYFPGLASDSFEVCKSCRVIVALPLILFCVEFASSPLSPGPSQKDRSLSMSVTLLLAVQSCQQNFLKGRMRKTQGTQVT